MGKSGTFDLEDINAELLEEIAFFDISYPGNGEPGCVMFITLNGDEYIISQCGTEWKITDIVKLFPDMYDVYQNQEKGIKDEYGFTNIRNWKIVPAFMGVLFVRSDYFENFYSLYGKESESNKDFPFCTARLLFGETRWAPDERMVYRTTRENWEKRERKLMARQRETEENGLSDADVPWMEYSNLVWEGYIKFWIRENSDGTFYGVRWLIQVQKEQSQEGVYNLEAPIECYNLFVQEYEDMDKQLIEDLEKICFTYISCHEAGRFVRSYKTLEKAKEAVCIRNEWIGWGNVNKKNIHMIDYEYLKRKIKDESEFFGF